MKRMFVLGAALALLTGATAYAWDRQATPQQEGYQSSHGQSFPTENYQDESSGRYLRAPNPY